MPLYSNIQKFRYLLPKSGKSILAFTFGAALVTTISRHCCENHETKYQGSFGKPEANIVVTQRFSLDFPEFIKFISRDFTSIKQEYVDTGKVKWTFCPIPTDVNTIQLVSYLDALPVQQKDLFFKQFLLGVNLCTLEQVPQMFLAILEKLSSPKPDINLSRLLRIGNYFRRIGEFSETESCEKLSINIKSSSEEFDIQLCSDAFRYHIEN